jgi:hypothetical protein
MQQLYILYLLSFICLLGFSEGAAQITGMPPSSLAYSMVGFAVYWTVYVWIKGDAAQCGLRLSSDFGLLLWLALPLYLPWYIWRTRKAKCLLWFAIAIGSYLSSFCLGWVAYYIIADRSLPIRQQLLVPRETAES